MKVKIKPLSLYVRNGRRQLIKARNVRSIQSKLPSDADIMRRYMILKEQGASKFVPFHLHLNHEESLVLIREIEVKKEGYYPAEALSGYDVILDNAVICRIDLNIDMNKL